MFDCLFVPVSLRSKVQGTQLVVYVTYAGLACLLRAVLS